MVESIGDIAGDVLVRCHRVSRFRPFRDSSPRAWFSIRITMFYSPDTEDSDILKNIESKDNTPLMQQVHVIGPWWRHQMEAFSALQALCEGNSPVTDEFPSQRPVTWSFNVFFDLRLTNSWANHRHARDLKRHHAHSLWRHGNALIVAIIR